MSEIRCRELSARESQRGNRHKKILPPRTQLALTHSEFVHCVSNIQSLFRLTHRHLAACHDKIFTRIVLDRSVPYANVQILHPSCLIHPHQFWLDNIIRSAYIICAQVAQTRGNSCDRIYGLNGGVFERLPAGPPNCFPDRNLITLNCPAMPEVRVYASFLCDLYNIVRCRVRMRANRGPAAEFPSSAPRFVRQNSRHS